MIKVAKKNCEPKNVAVGQKSDPDKWIVQEAVPLEKTVTTATPAPIAAERCASAPATTNSTTIASKACTTC
jgi:hypothetical protein